MFSKHSDSCLRSLGWTLHEWNMGLNMERRRLATRWSYEKPLKMLKFHIHTFLQTVSGVTLLATSPNQTPSSHPRIECLFMVMEIVKV